MSSSRNHRPAATRLVAARSAPGCGIKRWLIGDSPQMAKVAEDLLIAAPDDITVLITGEPGTGKESAANAIHHLSGRAKGPFVVADCGAFPESLIESELFGYVKGAFTGAVSDHKGLFEAEESRLPAEDKEREKLAEQGGRDGNALLDAIWSGEVLVWIRSIPRIETLRRVWVQDFVIIEGVTRWRQTDNVPPSSLRISSPYDTEARYAYKRSATWVGYKVHLTETCDEEIPNIITNVHADEAVVNDNDALPEIHQQLSQAELLPDRHLADAGYIEAQQLVESRQEYKVELIVPVQGNGRWQQIQATVLTSLILRSIGKERKRPVHKGRSVQAGNREGALEAMR